MDQKQYAYDTYEEAVTAVNEDYRNIADVNWRTFEDYRKIARASLFSVFEDRKYLSYRELVQNAFDFKGLDVLNYIPLDCPYSPSYFLDDEKVSTTSHIAREMHYLCMSYYDPNIEHISGNFLSTLEIYDKKKMLRLVSMYPGLLHLLFVDTKTLHEKSCRINTRNELREN